MQYHSDRLITRGTRRRRSHVQLIGYKRNFPRILRIPFELYGFLCNFLYSIITIQRHWPNDTCSWDFRRSVWWMVNRNSTLAFSGNESVRYEFPIESLGASDTQPAANEWRAGDDVTIEDCVISACLKPSIEKTSWWLAPHTMLITSNGTETTSMNGNKVELAKKSIGDLHSL